jgi:hypothetical protein
MTGPDRANYQGLHACRGGELAHGVAGPGSGLSRSEYRIGNSTSESWLLLYMREVYQKASASTFVEKFQSICVDAH